MEIETGKSKKSCLVFPRAKGFTLIELLVVISVLGLLVSLILANFNAARERARDLRRKSDLDQIKKSLRIYYNNDSSYPDHDANDDIVGCGTSDVPTVCTWDGTGIWQQASMTYMKLLPQDPNFDSSDPTSVRYHYQVVSGNQDFCLWATLENASDADLTSSQNRCSTCSRSGAEYVVCAD